MKRLILLSIFIMTSAQAEPLSYFKQFFDQYTDTTHDPEYPQTQLATAKNDLYQVKMLGPKKAIGLGVNLSLKEDGHFSIFLLKIDHQWENSQRKVRFSKCQAFNGQWTYLDGKLHLDNVLTLSAFYKDGKNLLKPDFAPGVVPQETEDVEVSLIHTSMPTFGFDEGQNFSCGLFSLPFWIPIPNAI